MDRPLDSTFVITQRRKRLLIGCGGIAVALALAFAASRLSGPSADRASLRFAVVDTGTVSASVAASGLVVPEVERLYTSPVDARILRIRHRAGAQVKAGDALIDLDVSSATLAVAKLDEDVALKSNEQARRRIALQRSLIDYDSRARVKRLQLESFRAQLTRDRQLSTEGLIAVEMLRRSELSEQQAAIELEQIEAERANAHEATRVELEGLSLETSKLRKDAAAARQVLELAAIRADRDGVVTYIQTQEGAALRTGDVVARIADLSTYRIEATVSDVHAARLVIGLPAVVRLTSGSLPGTLAAVDPEVRNGVMTVSVRLVTPNAPALRPNLRADVELVIAQRDGVVRVSRGPFASGAATEQVFVVRGDRAVRQAVRFGVAGFDAFEVIDGLRPGDEVVISDMRDFARFETVRLR
ncbi:MAG: HlyD family efflux transporter periplasmic adaptor subunit [Acidobacteria bacterium]|nr:HlyD family efflux transporter periplasmic adaptor subunit [Acidobacteriota bacterium]